MTSSHGGDRTRQDSVAEHHYASPAELVADTGLTWDEKLELLRQWACDADELDAAEVEGMMGGEPSLLHAVLEEPTRLEGRVGESRASAH